MVRVPIPPHLSSAPFAVNDGLEAGLGEKRLRGSDLTSPFWGVRIAASPDTLQERARAYSTRMQLDAFFSHTTAAGLHEIPLPLALRSATLHVSSAADLRGPTGRGVIGHHLHIDPRDIARVQGLSVTSLERTVMDLAHSLDDEAMVAALDNVLWWRRDPATRATPRSLDDAFHRFRGRRGRARLREFIPFATDRSDSPPESTFRLRFLREGFPVPEPNVEIYDDLGQFIAMPDLQFKRYKMAIDYEGDHHRTDRIQWQRDIQRVPRLEDAGWHHTRLSALDLAYPAEVLGRIRKHLVSRGWRPGHA